MSKIQSILLVIFASVVVGCSADSDRAGIDPKPENKASDKMTDSFSVVPNKNKKSADKPVLTGPTENRNFQKADEYKIAIFKSALGKEFLLSSNLLSQTPTPMFSGMQSRVVSFVERDGVVYLLDVTQNHKVGVGNTAQNILLAEFDIVFDDGFSVTIDFNTGMRKIFTVGDWFGSDDDDFAGAQLKLPLLQVGASFLDEVRLSEENLFIRQVAQVRISNPKGNEAQAYEVRYQLKPYSPDTTFKHKVSPGFDKVGYFEANPLMLNDGTTRVYVAKWHDSKPIKFAISANTPLKYRKVVRDGLMYWNKILGNNAVEVVQLEDKSITAPQFDTSIFQWADWDGAGYAFADAQVDPRSGQVTSAQIFFPSAFTDVNMPKRLRLLEGASVTTEKMGLQIQGLNHSHLCRRDVVKDLAIALESKDAFGISDEAMEKAMMDYVYEVVAHEMGHIIGLRHNFAGNLEANYDFKDRAPLIKQYYKNMKAPEGIVTSSSVMDYSRFEESAMNSDMAQSGAPALSYDAMAVNFLYNQEQIPEVRPVFCTDSQIEKYVDCNTSDAGRSVISSASGAYDLTLESMAARILNIYISKTKYPDDVGQDLTTVDQVNLNAEALAKVAGTDLAKVVSTLKSNADFIAVRGTHTALLKTHEEQLQAEELQYLESEFTRLGGLGNVLLKFNPATYSTELINQFKAMLNDPNYSTGKTRRGFSYSFSAAEKAVMLDAVNLLAKQLAEKLALQEIKALSGANFSFEESYGQALQEDKANWLASDLSDQLAVIQLATLTQYATAKMDTKTTSELVLKDGTKKAVELPVYKFSHEIRLKSLGLLSNDSEDNTWAFAEKDLALKAIKAEGEVIGETDSIDFVRLDRRTLKWILNHQELEKAIDE